MAKQDYWRTESARGSISTYSRSGSSHRLETSFNQAYEEEVILIESNLKDVINVLSEARDKWYDIGIQIDIPIQKLNDIREKYSASSDALREMLVFCSRQRRTRIMDFVNALRSPAVDLQVCATNLEAKVLVSADASAGSQAGGGEQYYPIVRRLAEREARTAECVYHFEVVIVGDPTVGKTTTVNKYFDVHPDHELGRSTIAATQHDPRIFEYKGKYVQLVLWDMPGNDECFNKVEPCNFESADGAILMFDVTNKQSFINLISDKDNSRKIKRSWRKELMFKALDSKHPMMVLVGNKIDAKKRQIQRSDVEEMLKSRNLDMPYFEISAKEGLDVENVFASVVEMLIKKASEDSQYGQVMRTDRCNSKSILASSITHHKELTPPRTQSLPISKSNQIQFVKSLDLPRAQQEPRPGTVSNSGDNARCCVIL